MTILDEVLIEEYKRSERIKVLYLQKLQTLPEDEHAEYLRQIEEIEFDQRKIRAALDVAGINT